MTESLGEAYPHELQRCEWLLDEYRKLPNNAGAFGALMIEQVIRDARVALSSGDVAQMVRSFAQMKECE